MITLKLPLTSRGADREYNVGPKDERKDEKRFEFMIRGRYQDSMYSWFTVVVWRFGVHNFDTARSAKVRVTVIVA